MHLSKCLPVKYRCTQTQLTTTHTCIGGWIDETVRVVVNCSLSFKHKYVSLFIATKASMHSFNIILRLYYRFSEYTSIILIYQIMQSKSSQREIFINLYLSVSRFTGGSRRSHWRGPAAANAKNTKQISKLGGSVDVPPRKFFFIMRKMLQIRPFFIFVRPLGGPWQSRAQTDSTLFIRQGNALPVW